MINIHGIIQRNKSHLFSNSVNNVRNGYCVHRVRSCHRGPVLPRGHSYRGRHRSPRGHHRGHLVRGSRSSRVRMMSDSRNLLLDIKIKFNHLNGAS